MLETDGEPSNTLGLVWRLWLIRVAPFLGRWLAVTPAACCGVCPTCLTTAASGLAIEVVSAKRPDRSGE